MWLQDSKQRIRNLTYCALFLAASVIISIAESVSGVNTLIPLPGVRLGFCNIAVTACMYLVSTPGAFAISVIRPLFMFVLSGNPVSLAMSMCGSVLSCTSLLITKKLYGKIFSFAGVSCVSAVVHSIGQIAAAMIIMGDTALLWYLPILIGASSIAGSVSGCVMNLVLPRFSVMLGGKAGFKA